RAAAIESNSRHQCIGQYRDVRLGHEWINVGTKDGLSLSVANGLIHERASPCRFHHAAIRVRKALQPHRLSAFQQCERERVRVRGRLHMHHSARTAVIRIGVSSPRLDTAAIQVDNCFITPPSPPPFPPPNIPNPPPPPTPPPARS